MKENPDDDGFRLDVVVAASGFKKSDQKVLEEGDKPSLISATGETGTKAESVGGGGGGGDGRGDPSTKPRA